MFTGGSMGAERGSPDLGIGLATLSGDGHDLGGVGQVPLGDEGVNPCQMSPSSSVGPRCTWAEPRHGCS